MGVPEKRFLVSVTTEKRNIYTFSALAEHIVKSGPQLEAKERELYCIQIHF